MAQVRAPVLGANLGTPSGVFWQKRYYDRNIRDEREFVEKLRYIHRNPVNAELCEHPEDWRWRAFVTMRCEKKESWKSSPSGRLGIGITKRQAARKGHS